MTVTPPRGEGFGGPRPDPFAARGPRPRAARRRAATRAGVRAARRRRSCCASGRRRRRRRCRRRPSRAAVGARVREPRDQRAGARAGAAVDADADRRAAAGHERAAADVGARARRLGPMVTSGPAAATIQADAPGRTDTEPTSMGPDFVESPSEVFTPITHKIPTPRPMPAPQGLSAAGSSVQKDPFDDQTAVASPTEALLRAAREVSQVAPTPAERPVESEFRAGLSRLHRDQAGVRRVDRGHHLRQVLRQAALQPAAADHAATRARRSSSRSTSRTARRRSRPRRSRRSRCSRARQRDGEDGAARRVEPPTRISPPWSVTMRCTMARPRPVPRWSWS